MLLFDFINPYITYVIGVIFFTFSVWMIFNKREFIFKHKNSIFTIATILLIWTQFARYVGMFFDENVEWSFLIFNFKIDGFGWQTHLPFYICRFSVVVLLYYVITRDKRVESFLFFWGATGIAGVLYPDSADVYNIYNLKETFFIDHYLLAVTPFFLVMYQGYRPSKSDAFKIACVMFVILTAFIPINNILTKLIDIDGVQVDYFYLNNQSIVGEITQRLFDSNIIPINELPSIIFALIHSIAAFGFFMVYYTIFRNRNFEVIG